MTTHDQYTQRGQDPYDQHQYDRDQLDRRPVDPQTYDQQPYDQQQVDPRTYDQQPHDSDPSIPPPPDAPPPTQERLVEPDQGELVDPPVHTDTAAVAYDEQAGHESVDARGTADARETSADTALFADDDLSGLRTDWDQVQATFVDDPQQCVRQADALVADVVEKLTTSFGTTRSRLEAQWAGGEEVSTEDLRVALTQYREFFKRLLAV